jgi:hypothetical protein
MIMKGETMKINVQLTLLFAMVMIATISLSAQKPEDLVGTWVGTATLEGEPEPNELNLVLELQDGKLVGNMTDQYGSMNETPAEEISLEEGVLSFSIQVEVPSGTFKVEFKMTVSGDSMEGELTIPDMGLTGKWLATRQK